MAKRARVIFNQMIKDVFIENFKCFENEEKFHFSKLNLLTGINGRGKSSLLQSLLVVSQTFIKKKNPQQLVLNGGWIELGTFDDIKNDNSNKNIISFRFKTDDIDQNDVCFKYTDSEKSERLASISSLIVNGEEKFIEATASSDTKDDDKDTKQQLQNKNLLPLDSVKLISQFQRFHYVSADRLGPVEYVKKNDNPESLNIGIKGENVVNVLAYNEDFNIEKSLCRSNNTTLKDQIVEWLSYILDGANIKVKGREDKELSILRFLLNSQQNGKFYKPINVGFGYSYILPIIATGLIAKAGDIFIIENPEAHLHPRAQSRLTEFFTHLAANNIQIFIESHSEHILNGLRINALNPNVSISNQDVSIYYFDEEFKSTKLNIDEKGKIANWPNGFFDQQEIDLANIFKYSR
jgi:predicted ATPase